MLQSALDSDPSNPKLYLQQLDLALHTSPLSVPAVVQLLDTAMAAEGLADKHKLLFAQRKVEFVQDKLHCSTPHCRSSSCRTSGRTSPHWRRPS